MKRIDTSFTPKASGYLISASISGILTLLVIIACLILSFVNIPTDIAKSVIGSLLWSTLILAPLAFFHYGHYMKLRYMKTEQDAAANP